MSDEEEVYEEEEEAPPEKPKSRPPPPPVDVGDTMTEAEKAMLAAKKKHEEEQANKLKEYEQSRSEELQRLEDELRELKERQAARKAERAQQELEQADRKRQEEQQRKQEEEERKRKVDEAKRMREQEKLKKMAMAAGRFGGSAHDSQMAMMQAQSEAKLTPEERAKQKAEFLAGKIKPLELSGLDVHALKDRVKQLHKRLTTLEGIKYDLENRLTTQEYDLKEMKERENQKARAEALKKGMDPAEHVSAKHPPKIQVASKFDRQTDRRGYGERREMYANPKPEELPHIYHGSCRPPPEHGRTAAKNEELEQLRKSMVKPTYQEIVPAEGDAARPPMEPIPPKE